MLEARRGARLRFVMLLYWKLLRLSQKQKQQQQQQQQQEEVHQHQHQQ